MANLDNLNFQVILKSDEFEKQIKKVQALADKFNISMSEALALSGVKGGTENARRLAKALSEATEAQKRLNAATKEGGAAHEKTGAAIRQQNTELSRQSDLMRQLSGLAAAYFSVNGARSFIWQLVTITGEFESQRVALESMLGSKDKADEIFSTLRRQALESPYTLQDLTKYAKQLTAFNVEADQLAETEKRLADVAAGLGVDMGRIVLAYGQVKSAGVLKGTELRQFTEAGVPILQQVADLIEEAEGHAVSLAEVFSRISKKKIPFEMVEEAFKRMTSEGGKFYNMQAELVETIKGKVGKLRDVWQQTLYDLGSEGTINDILKGSLDTITRIVAGLDNMGHVIAEGIALFGTYKTALLIAEAAAARLTVQETLASVAAGTLNRITKVLNKTLLLNPYAALAAGATVAVYAIYRAATAQSQLDTQLKNSNKAIADFEAKTSDEVSMLDYLFRNLERAKKGTKEYKAAKDQILSNYGEYISATDKEALRVGNLADVYDHLKESIIEANRARALEEGSQEISKTYSDTFNAIAKAFRKNFKERPADRGLMQELGDYLFGRNGVTKDTLSDAAKEYIKQVDQTIEAVLNTPGGMFGNGLSTTLTSIDALKNRLEEAEDAANSARDALADGLNLIYGPAKSKPSTTGGAGVVKDESKAGETAAAKAEREREKEIRAEIQSLNKQASLIQKYKDVYETLLPYMGENTPSALENLFGRKFDDTDFDTQLDRLIVKLAELGEEGQIAAESLRAALGKDEASELKKSLEAQEKAAEILAAYLEKDFGIEGEGIAAKISKMLADLANKNLKSGQGLQKFIDELDKSEIAKKTEFIAGEKWGNFSKEWQEIAAETYWQKYRAEQIKAYKEKMKLELEANKKLTNEQIVGQADDLFRQLTGGLDLTNWNDKTITQLREIRAILASLTIPEDVLAMIEDEETRNRFIEAFNLLRSNETDKGDKVIGEKSIHAAQRLLNIFQGIGAEITQMGDALGNDVLSGMGNILSLAEEVTGVITDNESLMRSLVQSGEDGMSEAVDDLTKSADWITMIVKLVLIVVKQFVNYFAQAKEEARAVTEALKESREIMFQKNLSQDVDSIFGKNFLQQLRNVRQELRQLNLDMGGTMGKFQGDAQGFFRKTGLFGMREEYMTLSEAAGHLGIPVFDDYGNINAELLKLIQKTYKLDEYSDRLIQNLLEESEHYAEIVQTVDDMMEDTFGNVASSAADDIVKRWIEAGDAALDYADILDDVAQSYAKMIIQSTILDEVFDKAHIRALAAQFINGDYSGAMATIADDMQRIADMQPIYEEILKVFDPYFNKDGGENTLANGIKGITEDTASLLASYINAIRADVSLIRTMNAAGWLDVSAISQAMPTLNDYLAQIAAHNANIEANTRENAEATREMLKELRGLIVNEGNGRGIRSYPA